MPESDRGFFGVGIVGTKSSLNVGTLWRSAALMGAGFIFTAGKRYPKQASDTIKAWKHVPMFEYDSAEDLLAHLPKDCIPVAVEQTDRSKQLPAFAHPERACYILGAEDTGLPPRVLERCPLVVEIPSARCLNVCRGRVDRRLRPDR